jgi:DNA topoisomerase-6 subunit A
MAKKKTDPNTADGQVHKRIKQRDKVTLGKIVGMADDVATKTFAGREPHLAVPVRARSNTVWNRKRGILEMGSNKADRQLFNLNQAKQYMQTLLHASNIKELIEREKTLTLRGMFYAAKHTVAGTNENTFEDQDESDPILEDLEVTLGVLREELHVFAKKAGTIAGNLTVVDRGVPGRADEIDLRRMGSGGWAVPSIVEPDTLEFKKCEAKFVLHVEKNTVWQRFNEDRFWEKHNCILTEGSGQPPRGVRRLLRRMHDELKLPVYCLLDCDPWGHYIYSVLKQGSMSLAFESERLAIPEAKFLGIRAKDYEECELPDGVKIQLNKNDTDRASQIKAYPWFKGHKGWQKEIDGMLRNGFKMEVESLIAKDISYVTEEYVPQRLKKRDWLD